MGGVLWAESLWVERLRDLGMEQFVKVVRQWGANGPGGWPAVVPAAGGPGPAGGGVLAAPTSRCGSKPRCSGFPRRRVCRVLQRLGQLLALESAPRPDASVDRLWIVDGPLIPVRDRTVSASGRNYRFSVNVQVIIDATPAWRWPRLDRHLRTRPMPTPGVSRTFRPLRR